MFYFSLFRAHNHNTLTRHTLTNEKAYNLNQIASSSQQWLVGGRKTVFNLVYRAQQQSATIGQSGKIHWSKRRFRIFCQKSQK